MALSGIGHFDLDQNYVQNHNCAHCELSASSIAASVVLPACVDGPYFQDEAGRSRGRRYEERLKVTASDRGLKRGATGKRGSGVRILEVLPCEYACLTQLPIAWQTLSIYSVVLSQPSPRFVPAHHTLQTSLMSIYRLY